MKDLIPQPAETLAKVRQNSLSALIAESIDADHAIESDVRRADELDTWEDGLVLLAHLKSLSPDHQQRELETMGLRDLRQLRRMVDAKKPSKDAPLYMVAALKRQEVRLKTSAQAGPSSQVNVILYNPPHKDDDDVIDIK
jgi:hypothetical protein